MSTSRFDTIPPPKPDPVFELDAKCKADKDPKKINLVIGAYRDDAGRPYVLHCVRAAEKMMLKAKMNKEYLPIDGDRAFCKKAVELLLGADCPPMEHIAAAQAISGTGALRLCAELYARLLPKDTEVYICDPTWVNHQNIFLQTKQFKIKSYRYFDPKTKGVDFDGMMADLEKAPNNSVLLLHICAHNPTGADPTPDQWESIAKLCSAKNFNVLFDSAYQGYASGDLEKDSLAAHIFVRHGLEFGTAQSFSKNMGLYGERVGCASFVCKSKDAAVRVQGVLKNIIRPMYSNPPRHGACIAGMVLTNPELRSLWLAELKLMSGRIIQMRQLLRDELTRLQTPGKWDHIVKQIGMFSYTGLTREQCLRLQKEYHIYLLPSGRVSMAGVTTENAVRFAKAIDQVVRTTGKSKL